MNRSGIWYVINSTYFRDDLGLPEAVFGRPDLVFAVLGLMACSAPSAVYARYTLDRSASWN